MLTRRPKTTVAISLVVAVLAVPAAVLASDRFTDVSNSNQFHDDINAIADAGITGGTGDGSTYSPTATVKRQAMAAFMHRGFGSTNGGASFSDASLDDGAMTVDDITVSAIGGISMDVPGVGGTQLVEITAQFKTASKTNCPCQMIWGIFDAEFNGSPFPVVSTTANEAHESMTWAFFAPSGINDFIVLALTLDNNGSVLEEVTVSQAIVTARTFPFLGAPATVSGASAGDGAPVEYGGTGNTLESFRAQAR